MLRFFVTVFWKRWKKKKETFYRFPVMWGVKCVSQPFLLCDARFSISLLLFIFHLTPRVRAHSSWNQTDLCDADVKLNSDILFITATLGHRGRPHGPLFGALFSICLLCSLQWHVARETSLFHRSRALTLKAGTSRFETDLRIYTVMSWDLQLSLTCEHRHYNGCWKYLFRR